MHRKSWKKPLLSVSMIGLALSLTATACSSDNSGGSKSNGEGEKQITLRMIESLTSPNRTAVIQEGIKAFMDQNPNIKVELISPPFDQADNKIRTMLNAKQDLDVLEVRDLNVAEFVNNGYVEPLNDYTPTWDDFSTVTSVAQSVATVGDKLYFIPNGLYQRQLFYRADYLKDAGIEVPKTYEELVEASVKLTDPSNNRFGFSFRGGSGANAVPDAIIQAYNSEIIDIDDAMFLKDGGTMYSSPEAKEAVELYVKLFKEGSPPDSINWGFQEQVQAFSSGVTAFLLQDPDVIQSLTDSMDEGTWATAPMPTGPHGKALINAGGAGWGIASHSENKEAAFKLISFLSSPEENTKLSKSHGTVPIHSSATEDEYFSSGPYKTLLDMTNQPETFINFKPPFQYPANGQWGTVAMESGQQLLLGRVSAEDTLKAWDDYWVKAKEQLNK